MASSKDGRTATDERERLRFETGTEFLMTAKLLAEQARDPNRRDGAALAQAAAALYTAVAS